MKAAVYKKYGSPKELKIVDYPRPKIKENEVLVQIHNATVTAGDCEMRRFDLASWIWLPIRLYMGVFRPRIQVLGQEFAGVVVEVGEKVTTLKRGDRIFAPTDMSFGGYAEFISLDQNAPHSLLPEGMSFETAATIPTGGGNALYFAQKGNISENDEVLIVGAGGSIGSYLIQMVKSKNARVTAIDHGAKLELLKSLGADHVIDYNLTDFASSIKKYDVVIDIVCKSSLSASLNVLKAKGRYIVCNPTFGHMMRALKHKLFKQKKIIIALAPYSSEQLNKVATDTMNKNFIVPIDRTYNLDQIAEAHEYVETGKKKGHVLISIKNDDSE